MSDERLAIGARALEQMGFPRRSAAILAGNINQESSWRAGARESAASANQFGYNPGQAGVGLVQWSFGRRDKILKQFGGQLPDAENQLNYMINEMKTGYSDAYNTFMNPNATDDELWKASKRYWGWGHEGSRRQYAQRAQQLLDQGALPNSAPQGRQIGQAGSLTARPINPAINDYSQQFQSSMQQRLASTGLDDEFQRNEKVLIDGQEYGRAVKDGKNVLVRWGSIAGTGGPPNSNGGGQSASIPSSSPMAQVPGFNGIKPGQFRIYADHWRDFSPTTKSGDHGALDYTIVDTKTNSDRIPKYNPFEGGTVTFAGPANGYGNFVAVKDANGLEWGVGHVTDVKVKVGDRLPKGAILAFQGNEGRSTGTHTHGELRFGDRLLGGAPLRQWGAAYVKEFYGVDVKDR
ncbi:phage tail tip lysozyme [Synechococcus elongatus]|uniref:phage tail tip lysozyme n=1 Tax=Synechococcus elongatus TaxID=32046 RepID=UPI000F7D88E9|nr:phage tail tip lysozyme [Synechococcus elongatus]